MSESLNNILQVFCQISNASIVYILKTEKSSFEILKYYGEYDENDNLITGLNADIIRIEEPTSTKLKYVDSFNKLLDVYNYHSVFISEISKNIDDKRYFLVGLSKNETLFNKNIKDKISVWFPILEFHFSQLISDFGIDDKNKNRNSSVSEQYDFLISTTTDFVFTLDSKGVFTNANESGLKTLGYTSENLIGQHFLDFIDDEAKTDVAMAFQKVLTSKKTINFLVSFINKYRNKVLFEVCAKPILENSQIVGMFGFAKNNAQHSKAQTQLEEMQAKLTETQRILSIERDRAKQQISVLEELNRLKNEFISNVSHELRTPLASIVGFSETIASDREMPNDTVHEFIDIILGEGKRLAKLVNDILDFSKLESGEDVLDKQDFDIWALIAEIEESFKPSAEEKQLNVSFTYPESEVFINADKERITKSLNHIMSNAIKFTPANGRITVIVQEFLKEVEIIISDTGIGIPKEALPNIFQKFYKVNRPGAQIPGAGFGLITAKKIIDAHKGLIQIKSELDKGTTVLIRLPKYIN